MTKRAFRKIKSNSHLRYTALTRRRSTGWNPLADLIWQALRVDNRHINNTRRYYLSHVHQHPYYWTR